MAAVTAVKVDSDGMDQSEGFRIISTTYTIFIVDYVQNTSMRDFINFSKFSRRISTCIKTSYVVALIYCEIGLSWIESIFGSLFRIHFGRSHPQVIGINTPFIIAFVHDYKSFRNNAISQFLVRNYMGAMSSILYGKTSIAIFGSERTKPSPTFCGFDIFNIIENSFSKSFAHG